MKQSNILRSTLVGVLTILIVSIPFADVPQLIQYQGKATGD